MLPALRLNAGDTVRKLPAVRDRKQIAQGFVILAALFLFASGAFHAYGGVIGVFPALRSSNLSPAVVAAVRVIWLIVSYHWILLGILVLIFAFSRNTPRRLLLLLSGLIPLVDAAGAYYAAGLFIGVELLAAAAGLLLLAALLFPPRGTW